MGQLVFQATLGGQVNLVGPNTASTFNLNVPAIAGTLVTTGDTGTVTKTMLATGVYTAPGTIGSGTPSTGAFTTLSATGVTTVQAGSAGAPAITTSGDTNTGIFFPAADTVGIATGGTERARVDSSGNLGLGVTPSAWNTYKALEIGRVGNYFAGYNGGTETTLGANAYYATGWKYAITGALATRYMTDNTGIHAWFNAPSGTAGNAITFTQAMTLDASGNLGIGATSPSAKLTVTDSNGIPLRIGDISSAPSSQTACYVGTATSGLPNSTNGDLVLISRTSTTSAITFWSGNGTAVERARIDSSGNLIQTVNTTAATLTTNQTLTFSIVNDSLLRISVRGSDGTTRTATMALT